MPLRRGDGEGQGWRSQRRGDRDGPADLRPAPVDRVWLPRRRHPHRVQRRRPLHRALGSGSSCVLVEATNDDRIAREEVFGPGLAALIPFDDEADAYPDRQRHALRPVRIDLDAERRTRSPASPARRRAPCAQLSTSEQLLSASPRRSAASEAVRVRPGAGDERARRLLGSQERLLLDGGLTQAWDVSTGRSA